ncbi:MAG: MoaD/ThiS family protein [Chloroflexota bacterium]|nr:MoaD/ThiS family protein [Chloroflexota bacterium]
MINLEIWLYGPLARYGGDQSNSTYAQLLLQVPRDTTVGDLLKQLSIPLEEKGITFINGQLSDMPGLAADLQHILEDGDRIGLFSPRSMWPFQYRFGANMIPELQEKLEKRADGSLHHSYHPGHD